MILAPSLRRAAPRRARGEGRQRLSAALAVGLLALLGAEPVAPARRAHAEHEVHYRYTVLGYVRDAAGRPEGGRLVEVVREKTGLAYRGVTDAEGFYVIVVRLGDESAGESLRVRTGGRGLTVAARFDPADRARERGTRVDASGDRLAERPPAFATTLRQFLAR